MAENGWLFKLGDGSIPDTINGAEYMNQIYYGITKLFGSGDRAGALG